MGNTKFTTQLTQVGFMTSTACTTAGAKIKVNPKIEIVSVLIFVSRFQLLLLFSKQK